MTRPPSNSRLRQALDRLARERVRSRPTPAVPIPPLGPRLDRADLSHVVEAMASIEESIRAFRLYASMWAVDRSRPHLGSAELKELESVGGLRRLDRHLAAAIRSALPSPAFGAVPWDIVGGVALPSCRDATRSALRLAMKRLGNPVNTNVNAQQMSKAFGLARGHVRLEAGAGISSRFLKAALLSTDSFERASAVGALGATGSQWAVGHLTRTLRDDRTNLTRWAAAASLRAYRHVPVVQAELERAAQGDPDSAVQVVAKRSLEGKGTPPRPDGAPSQLLQDKATILRRRLRDALSLSGANDDVQDLLPLTRAPHPLPLRAAAVDALARHEESNEAGKGIADALASEDDWLVAIAARAYGEWVRQREDDEMSEAPLLALLDHSSPIVREYALRSLIPWARRERVIAEAILRLDDGFNVVDAASDLLARVPCPLLRARSHEERERLAPHLDHRGVALALRSKQPVPVLLVEAARTE